MTRIKNATFESNSLTGTNGADTSSGTGITINSSAPLKGLYSADVNTTAISSYVQVQAASPVDQMYVSFYVYLRATPATNTRIMEVRDNSVSYSSVRIGTDTTIRLYNSAGAQAGSSVAISLNTLYRVGFRHQKGTGANGILEMYVVAGDDPFPGTPNASSATDTCTVQITRVRCGCPTSSTLTLLFDNLRVDDASMPTDDVAASNGAADLTATATVSASPEMDGAADLTASAVVSASPAMLGAADLAASAVLAAAPAMYGAADLTATATVDATGGSGTSGYADLTASATVSASPEMLGYADLTASVTVTASPEMDGAADLTATATVAASAAMYGAAALTATATVSASPNTSGAASLTASATVSATAASLGSAAIVASVTIDAAGQQLALPSLALLTGGFGTQLQVAVYEYADGPMVADWSYQVSNPRITTNEHGDATFELFVELSPSEALAWYEGLATQHVEVSEHGFIIWQGRLEDISLQAGGIRASAIGQFRAFTDVPITVAWSDSGLDHWRVLTKKDGTSFQSERFEFNSDEGLEIQPKKNTVHGTGYLAVWFYEPPASVAHLPQYISFDYELKAPLNWQCGVQRLTAGLSFVEQLWTGNGEVGYSDSVLYTGQTGTFSDTFTGAERLGFYFYYTGSDVEIVAEPDKLFIRLTNMRVIYAPQATMTADVIAADMLTTVAAVNPTQLRTSTAFLQSPGLDLRDAIYEDADMGSVLDDLISLGDTATPPRVWQAMIRNRALVFAPQGDDSFSKSWLIEVDDEGFDVEQTLDTLINSLYSVYKDVSGRTQRTAITTDEASTQRYGLTRRQFIQADTTDVSQAEKQRDLALQDRALAPPRVKLPVRRVMTEQGAMARWWELLAGDKVTIVNLPYLTTALDNIQTFYVSQTSYDFGRMIEVTPSVPPARLAVIVEQQKRGLR